MIWVAIAGVRHNWQVFVGLLVSIALSVGVLYLAATVLFEVPRAPASAATVEQVTAQLPTDSVIVRMSTRPHFPGTDIAWTACDRPLPAGTVERVRAVAGVERADVTTPRLCSPANMDVHNTIVVTPANRSVDAVADDISRALLNIADIEVRPGSVLIDEAISAAAAQTADWVLSAISGFGLLLPVAAVFVVASTASFSVAARRRDTALLRLSGASSLQASLLVILESLVIASVAGVLGVALGIVISIAYLDRMLAYLAPDPPYVGVSLAGIGVSFLGGLLIAAVGSAMAAWRATRVRAITVLRDNDDSRPRQPWLRLATAAAAFGLFALTVQPMTSSAGSNLASVAFIAMIPAVLVVVATAPWIAAGTTRLVAAMFRRSTRASLLLASQGVDTDRRRSTSIAASLGLALGLTAALFTLVPTTASISLNAAADESRFSAVLTPIDADTDLSDLPDDALTLTTRTLASPASWALGNAVTVASTDLRRLPQFVDVKPVHENLRDDEMLVSEFGARLLGADIGSSVALGLPDGSIATLIVAGTYADTAPLPEVVVNDTVTSSTTHSQPTIWLRGDLASIPRGFTVQSADEWLAATAGAVASTGDMLVMIGIPVGLALIAATNMLLMSAPSRRRELGTLRRLGAGRHLVNALAIEGVLLTALGAIAGGIVATLIALPLAANAFSDGIRAQPMPVIVLLAATAGLMAATNVSLVTRRTALRA